jgi:hypothetical protein
MCKRGLFYMKAFFYLLLLILAGISLAIVWPGIYHAGPWPNLFKTGLLFATVFICFIASLSPIVWRDSVYILTKHAVIITVVVSVILCAAVGIVAAAGLAIYLMNWLFRV